MKKKIIVLSLLVLIIAACFIPVTQQKTISVKAPFLKVFGQLSEPLNWENWRTDLNKIAKIDSTQISITKASSNSFQLKYQEQKINVNWRGSTFVINDAWGNNTIGYTYTVVPVADKFLNKSLVTVNKKTPFFIYLLGKFKSDPLLDTHIGDVKRFLETDSLLYGCNIFKTGVPETNLIEIKKEVLSINKLTEAAKMLATLQQYVKTHDVKQMEPPIAQFLPKGKDSVHINVGMFINKEVKTENDVIFTRMPNGGRWYSTNYTGKFNKRQKAYIALHQYFADHLYQSPILPFEMYLDNKLPVSDTDKINIRVNIATYY